MSTRKRLHLQKPYRFNFDPNLPSQMTVKLGEEFEVETLDAFCGECRKPEDAAKVGTTPNFGYTPAKINPLTGPIYIEGVERGDIIVVEILDVVPEGDGYVVRVPGMGQIAYDSRWPETHKANVRPIKLSPGISGTLADGKAQFPRDDSTKPPIEWDVTAFFGTIGVAPDHETISGLTGPYVASKGAFGGNWDCRDIKKGSKIYLNAYNDGGLFYVGDLHASQGDGEWCGVANEAAGYGAFKCDVIKKASVPYTRIEKEESIVQLNNGRPVELTLENAGKWLMEWLCEDYGFEQMECVDFLATCPGFKFNVYQSVEDHYTVGAEIPKKYLPKKVK